MRDLLIRIFVCFVLLGVMVLSFWFVYSLKLPFWHLPQDITLKIANHKIIVPIVAWVAISFIVICAWRFYHLLFKK